VEHFKKSCHSCFLDVKKLHGMGDRQSLPTEFSTTSHVSIVLCAKTKLPSKPSQAIRLQYTLCLKKASPLMIANNFGKCGPIFKIFSPGDS